MATLFEKNRSTSDYGIKKYLNKQKQKEIAFPRRTSQ